MKSRAYIVLREMPDGIYDEQSDIVGSAKEAYKIAEQLARRRSGTNFTVALLMKSFYRNER